MLESKPIHILYMEDDPGLARLFQKKLRRAGYMVDIARNGEEGLEMYHVGFYDVIATDQAMPIHNGLEVIRILASQGPLPPTIMVTGTGSEQIAVEAMKLGASDYIVKDVDGGYLDLLPAVIERVLQQQRLMEEKQQAEESLRQYTAELEARNEELDAFAHTVAHDLKGPLAHIVGFAQVLAADYDTLPDKDLRGYLQTIARSGKKMSNIIDELLLLASVRKVDELNIELKLLDMTSIVAAVQERLGYLIEEHQAQISVPEKWPLARGYDPWLEEVWVNYLSNAIKYGGQPPHIELGATAPEDPNQPVHFWVRDNGAGLTPEEQERLFTPFTRIDRTRAKGHGLGLSIARRIVKKLDGQVGVESKVGAGSTFWFTLPQSDNE
ncbi:MAG: response regulator [Chloroflexi bacterium]|nr:response regulator [Chloroflexota bacterium]